MAHATELSGELGVERYGVQEGKLSQDFYNILHEQSSKDEIIGASAPYEENLHEVLRELGY